MIGHPGTERADPIAGDVRAVRRDSRERYGARKIKAALERRGVTASRRRIGGIMREQGMTSAYARKRPKPHKTRADEAGLANLLDREFDGYAPRTHLASCVLSSAGVPFYRGWLSGLPVNCLPGYRRLVSSGFGCFVIA